MSNQTISDEEFAVWRRFYSDLEIALCTEKRNAEEERDKYKKLYEESEKLVVKLTEQIVYTK